MPIIHTDPDFLMHHGILGMKWGVRRYQNKDGTLTPAGIKRYVGKDAMLNSKGERRYKKSSPSQKYQMQSQVAHLRERNSDMFEPDSYEKQFSQEEVKFAKDNGFTFRTFTWGTAQLHSIDRSYGPNGSPWASINDPMDAKRANDAVNKLMNDRKTQEAFREHLARTLYDRDTTYYSKIGTRDDFKKNSHFNGLSAYSSSPIITVGFANDKYCGDHSLDIECDWDFGNKSKWTAVNG